MTSKDFTAIPNTTANEIQENITTHNILVITMIIHYLDDCRLVFINDEKRNFYKSGIHRTFSMLVLHLIQCPDLTFEELNNLISCGKYQLSPRFIKSYHLQIIKVINNGVDGIIDMFKTIEGTFVDSGLPKVFPAKIANSSSPVGTFLRRGVVFFDKMLFLQIEAVMKELRSCCSSIIKKYPVRLNDLMLSI